jgi:uncharacterized protein
MDPIDPIHQFEALSQRQQEVLRWFGQGKSDREISHLLDITENTVRKHLSAVHDKICPDNSIPGHQIRSALMKFWSQVVQTQTPIGLEITPNNLNEILQNSPNEVVALVRLQRAIDEGAEVNQQDSYGRTPLFLAVEKSYGKVMQFLFEQATIDLNLSNRYYMTPLHRAASLGHMSIVDRLLRSGADATTTTWRGGTTIYEAAFGSNYPEIVKVLEEAGADINRPSDDGLTPLMVAIIRENYIMAEYLIERSNNLDTADYDGETAFYKAVKVGNHDLVTQLLQRNVKYEKRPISQSIIYRVDDFFKAVSQNDRTQVEKMITTGTIDLDRIYTRYERTALHQAALCGYFDIVKLLVAAGANIYAPNNHGRTPRELTLMSHDRIRNYLAEQEALQQIQK